MKQFIITLLLLSIALSTAAQNGYEPVLQQIEANSVSLRALREQMEAQKLNNRTGISLPNPEVEYHYLRGTPRGTGDRTDISVSQSFDFPTAYGYRNRIADLLNADAETVYRSERINLLLSAQQLCIDLVYCNALNSALDRRLQNAESLAQSYQIRLERGDANRLEYNKAQWNLSSVRTEKTRIEAEQIALLLELRRMNGDRPISFPDEAFPAKKLPPDFETWYASIETRNPTLQRAARQIEIGRQQLKLNRALALPRFSAGYMSEKIVGEHLQGITLGLALPLWENKNRLKQAKAQIRAAESSLSDAQSLLLSRLKSLFLKANALQTNAQQLRATLLDNDSEPLLKKALDAGEISLLTYLLEADYFYNTLVQTLEAERDYERALAELTVIER
jgi:outer membrane protein TolC